MKSIAEIPVSVILECATNPEIFWAWVSEQHDAQMLEQASDEWLVRIRQRFQLEGVVAVCQAYHQYAGKRGQAASYPIVTLCWALLLKHLNGWSYRRASWEIRTNGLVRWFVGYRLHDKTVSYVTLQRFAVWVNEHQPRLFFNEILKQINQDFPVEAKQAQVGDTFALLANVGPQSRTALLCDTCRRLLDYWQQVDADDYAEALVLLNGEVLFGRPSEHAEYRLEKSARDGLEGRTALAADACLQLVQQRRSRWPTQRTLEFLALTKWAGYLAKLLRDEFVFGRNAAGVAQTVRPCTKEERGSFVLGSTVDPEATFRKHGEKNDFGYNVQVAATINFIREIFAATGATSDASGVALLIEHQKAQLGLLPPKLIYDRAAGSPKIFHDVAKASDGKTQLVARLIDHSQHCERFGPLDFTLNQDGSLTCPNQQSTHTFYPSRSADGDNYRFPAAQCQDCPHWQRCRGADRVPKANKRKSPKPTAYRQVFISRYRALQRKAILYTKTAQFKLDMQFRSTIERIIAALVRYNDARHAHSRGLLRADFQARMAAIAYNLKKWHKLTLAKQKAALLRPPDAN